jgi:Tol biopolymer transport system component
LGIEQLTNDGLEKVYNLVTDGPRIYFIERSRDGDVVAEVPSTGGSPVTIAKASAYSFVEDISPDRSELLLVEGPPLRPGAVWILPLLGGSAQRLGNIEAFSAAWSPDGTGLAYTTDDGLYLCDANGSNSRRIVAMPGRLESVRWSPGGKQLCFSQLSPKEPTLWEVDRDGRGLRRLVPDRDLGTETGPVFWTPDGKYLLLGAISAGTTAPFAVRMHTRLLPGPNGQPVRLGGEGLNLAPATISPDASRVYCFGSTRGRFEMERFDLRAKQLVPFLSGLSVSALDFTKDGGWIAYVDDRECLSKCRYNGGEKVRLTLPPLAAELPRWSPDGKRIAFMGRAEGRPWKVRVVSAEGGSYEPLTSTDAAEGAPTWSPDGSRVAFGGLVDPADRAPGPLVIHIYDLKERQLTVVPQSEGLWTARWSPDGRYIAALTEDSRSLMLFDFRIGKWATVLALGRIWDLRWSRQGKSVYLNAASADGEPALFRVEIPGHHAERLINVGGTDTAGWLGLAPDDSPLIVRRATTVEIYALRCQFPK